MNIRNLLLSNSDHPYRLFFPFSLAGLLSGLLPLYFSYSSETLFWHKELMLTLFLLPAATGFLFTAAPRFLGCKKAGFSEFLLMLLSFFLLILCFLFRLELAFEFLKTAVQLQLTLFFFSRWRRSVTKNQHWPPFILTGLAAGSAGSILQLVFTFLPPPQPEWVTLANRLYYEAQFWILLSGIGVRFFPMITQSSPPAFRPGAITLLSARLHESAYIWYAAAVLLLLSFVLESFGFTGTGLWLRVFVMLFIGYEGWSLLEKPKRQGITTRYAQIAMTIILAGHLLLPFFPSLLTHLYHFMFIAGFLSMTLMVITRVTLSHEQVGIDAEQDSPYIKIAYPVLGLALVFRITAVFLPHYYLPLQYGAVSFVLTGILLLTYMLFKALRRSL